MAREARDMSQYLTYHHVTTLYDKSIFCALYAHKKTPVKCKAEGVGTLKLMSQFLH